MTTPLIEAVARAWDAEEAAQTGEPSPWSIPLDGGNHDARWAESRMSLAIAALTAIEAAGFRVVPVDATFAMVMASLDEVGKAMDGEAWDSRQLWADLLQAAPRITP